MSAQFVVSTKVTADASQYTSELTRAGQTTATYTQQVQAADTAAQSMGSGLRTTAAAAQASSTAMAGAQQTTASAAQALTGAINNANKAHAAGTISAAQHAAAMRMLPAQITDVVTSMASGMPVWMVAIQQGGQIKDSFGGVSNAMRAMLGAITPTVAAVGLLAGATGVLVAAYYQGSKENQEFANSIITTGNASGVTVSQLRTYAQAIDGVVGTQAQAVEGLAAFTQAGVRGGDQLKQYTQTAIEWERATGQAVDKTAERFAGLQKDPLTAVIKLNEGTNFLTRDIYEQIKALDGQGKSVDASRVAMDALDASMRERSKAIEGNLGYIERAWRGIKTGAKEAWDAMLNVGRANTDQQNLDQLRQNLERLEERNARPGYKPGRATEELRAQIKALEDKIAAENKSAEATAHGNTQLQARIEWDKAGEKFLGKQARLEGELAKAREQGAAAGASAAEIEQRLAGIREKYKDPKAAGGIAVSDNELATLQGQLQAARLYHEQLVTLGSGASELNAGERESLKIGEQLARVTDAKTTARLREKQAIADALGVQLRSNDGLEKSLKAHQASIDAAFKDADAITQRAAAQEAANTTLGKSKTAIEQLTLAELQKQMAEAQATDSFDPKYIAGLELKIAAQQRYVNALGQADYKAAEEHANELLRNAQELGRAYEDEQQLSGLTALEREKITAQRQVELRYAKELAAIDAKALSDAEKQALRDKTLEAKRVETAAAVGKAEQQAQARASEEINRSLTDALMRGFESGKGLAQNLADTTVNLFKTMVLRPTISAIMQPVSLVINGIVQQGLNAVGLGSGSNVLGMAANGASLYTGLTSGSGILGTVGGWLGMGGGSGAAAGLYGLGTGATGLGLSASAGGLGLSATGGGLGLSAGVGGTTTAAASGGGLMGSLSAIPGWGWALAGVAALGALLSKKQTLHAGAGAIYSADSGLQEGAGIYNLGTFGMGDVREYSKDRQQLASGIAQGLGTALDGMARAFGRKAGYEVATAFADDSSKDGAWGSLRISQGGKDLLNWDDTRTSRWAPREFADGEVGQKEYLAAIAKDTRQVLLDMDLPGWADTLLTNLGEVANMDALSAAVAQIGQIQSLFVGLGKNIKGFANYADDAITALLKATGGAEKLATLANSYYQNYYTEGERSAAMARDLTTQFAALGYTLPQSRDELRALVDANLALGAAGAPTLAALLNIQGAFAQLVQSGEDAAAATAAAAKAEADARKAATDAAWAAMQKSIAAARDAAQAEIDLRQQRLATAQAIVDLTRNQARELRGLVTSTVAITAAQANAAIDAAVAAARSGQLPEQQGLSEAISAARAGMGTSAYTNRLDYEAAQLILANKLDAIGDSGQAQVDVNQLLLEQAKNEVDRLDMLIKAGQAALDEARGNTVAVRDVETAVKVFYERLFKEQDSNADTGSGTGSSGSSPFVSGPGGGSGGGMAPGDHAELKAQNIRDYISGVYSGSSDYADAHALSNISAMAYLSNWSLSDMASALKVPAEDIVALMEGAGFTHWRSQLPAFAAGGSHRGGLRLVGEDGPELEVTGPSRIYNASQTQQLLAGLQGGSNAEVVAAIRELQRQGYDIGRTLIVLMQSMENLARKQDAIGVLQREPVAA